MARDPDPKPSMTYADADGCGNVLVYGWSADRTEVITFRADDGSLRLPRGTARTFDLASMTRSLSLNIHVYDRPLRPAFCSDARVPSPPGALWRAVAGSITIELSPRGIRARAPNLYRATVHIVNAQFVNESGGRVRQTQPITLTAMVGRVGGTASDIGRDGCSSSSSHKGNPRRNRRADGRARRLLEEVLRFRQFPGLGSKDPERWRDYPGGRQESSAHRSDCRGRSVPCAWSRRLPDHRVPRQPAR